MGGKEAENTLNHSHLWKPLCRTNKASGQQSRKLTKKIHMKAGRKQVGCADKTVTAFLHTPDRDCQQTALQYAHEIFGSGCH